MGEPDQLIATCLQPNVCLALEAQRATVVACEECAIEAPDVEADWAAAPDELRAYVNISEDAPGKHEERVDLSVRLVLKGQLS